MKIYYYTDKRGVNFGSTNEFKITAMASQNHAEITGSCDIKDFDGILLGQEYL